MTVLVVVSDAEAAGPLVRWGARFARAREETLTVFFATRGTQASEAKDLPLEDPEDQHPIRLAVRHAIHEACAMLVDDAGDGALSPAARVEAQSRRAQSARDSKRVPREALGEGEEEPAGAGIPEAWSTFVRLRGVAHPDAFAATMQEIQRSAASLVVVGRHNSLSSEGLETDLATLVLERAPCDAMLIRAASHSGQRCARVLIPAAGGPHAPVALRLAKGLTRQGAEVQPLYVEQEGGADDESKEVGYRRLGQVLAKAGLNEREELIQPRVELGDNPTKVIGTCAQEGYDLVLIGASNQGFIQRLLFKTVPERLLAGDASVAIAVVRRGTPLSARVGAWFSEWIERLLPRIEREDRVRLLDQLETGGNLGVDFLTLIALSTGIASLGLVQNSPAVVIGAMLVAPLMTPMVGAGLALVQDNVVLARACAQSIVVGFLMALFIGFGIGKCFGWVLPQGALTHELLARGGPNALDLGVAVLSGLAAAYAIARPKLSGALPGVAIAAALVPPIGTAGISLAMGHYQNAQGAALLFGTNLIAIILGAALTFWLVGIRANKGATKRRTWVRRILISLLIALVAVSIPLGLGLLEAVAKGQRTLRLTDELQAEVEARIGAEEDYALVSIRRSHLQEQLEIVLVGPRPPGQRLIQDLARIVSKRQGHPVPVEVTTIRRDSRQLGVARVTSGSEAPLSSR